MGRILIVDDEENFRELISQVLSLQGHTIETAADVNSALNKLADFKPQLILSDVRMPGDDGLVLLEKVKRLAPDTDVMIMTAYGSKESAVEALRLGAGDYIEKPFDNSELKKRIQNLLDRRILEQENLDLKNELKEKWSLSNFIGRSAAVEEVSKLVVKVSSKSVCVLVRGESGTGKELVAKAIHESSPYASGPFIAVNSSAMPENLIESELFGHEKGAFTGAYQRKEGKFEAAAGGTLFLDEIGDISAGMQAKLLRVLQEKQFTRVGGNEIIPFNGRVVAATNRDLESLLKAGKFREDLYYRLNIFPIFVAPLRNRQDDVPLLVEHFLQKLGFNRNSISSGAMEKLLNYSWPGNVRELENTLERATILCSDQEITENDLPIQVKSIQLAEPNPLTLEIPDGGINLEEVEHMLILKAIEKAGGNKTKAAKLLNLSRRTLYSRLDGYKDKGH